MDIRHENHLKESIFKFGSNYTAQRGQCKRQQKPPPEGGGLAGASAAQIPAGAKARNLRDADGGNLWRDATGHDAVISNADETADLKAAGPCRMNDHPL